MKKKILIFIETGGAGGAEKVVLETAVNLKNLGFDVTVGTLRLGWLTNNLNANQIPHQIFESKRKFDLGLIYRLASFIKKEKFTVVHSHLLDSNFYCSLACYLTKTPHVASEHGDVHHLKLKKLTRLKLNIVSLLKTKMTAVSKFTADKLKSLGYNSEVTVIGNPVDTNFHRDFELREKTRNKLGLEEEDLLWINIANLREVKDQFTLIKGFAKAAKQKNNLFLLLLGEGPERPTLENLIKNLDLDYNVKLVGFCPDTRPYLEAADGFILSSKSEALPLSLLEAAVSGLTVVATNVGGIPEIIKNNYDGFLFESGNDLQLAELLVRISNDPQTMQATALNLQEKIAQNFSLQKYIEKLSSIYSAF